MKKFNQWYRTRANVVGDVNEVFGMLRRWKNDPRGMFQAPHTRDEALNNPQFQQVVRQFANNIGINITRLTNTDSIYQSLLNLVIARMYGPKYGDAVEEGDLSNVWNYITRPNKNGVTLAKRNGITRPLAMMSRVPGVTNAMKYNITQDAADFDRQAVEQGRTAQNNAGTAGTGGTGGAGTGAGTGGTGGTGTGSPSTPPITDPQLQNLLSLIGRAGGATKAQLQSIYVGLPASGPGGKKGRLGKLLNALISSIP